MTQHKIPLKQPQLLAIQPAGRTSGRHISVIGLGYVGLMIASAFAQNEPIIGFDINIDRINALKNGNDVNGEVSAQDLKRAMINYTTDANDLAKADFHIIAVPTPLDKSQQPDLKILIAATKMVGAQLKKGDIVVYESSVYPGATEELCIPLLEEASHLTCGKDFGVGYSPERINPADKEHNLSNIPKLISAVDKPTLKVIADVYNSIVKVGVYELNSIRAAEATKVIENIQRDLNISLVNEVALILHSLKMDSAEVFKAMQTKWNHLPFKPGLVGGHCIPVNSYYLAHKAKAAGFQPEVIMAARHLNEKMPKYIVDSTLKQLINLNKLVKGARVAIFGLTYKENTPDVHDTPAIEIINELKSYSMEVLVYDPVANVKMTKKLYDIDLCSWGDLNELDAIVIIQAHREFIEMDKTNLKSLFKDSGVIMDVRGICNPNDFQNDKITLWRL